jgi:hypothetical protein
MGSVEGGNVGIDPLEPVCEWADLNCTQRPK